MRITTVLLAMLVLTVVLVPSVRAQTDWGQEWDDFVQFFIDILNRQLFELFGAPIFVWYTIVLFLILIGLVLLFRRRK